MSEIARLTWDDEDSCKAKFKAPCPDSVKIYFCEAILSGQGNKIDKAAVMVERFERTSPAVLGKLPVKQKPADEDMVPGRKQVARQIKAQHKVWDEFHLSINEAGTSCVKPTAETIIATVSYSFRGVDQRGPTRVTEEFDGQTVLTIEHSGSDWPIVSENVMSGL